jgi:hypothetical protein
MRLSRSVRLGFAAVLLTFAADARAEWTAAAYLGASWTSPASLTLDQPARGIQVNWPRVEFTSRSFESPPYYGYRLAWFPSEQARVGVEGELTHLKVFARNGSLLPAVQRFSISHGLNLLVANVIWRQPANTRQRIWFTARGGVGVAVPHGESDVFGVAQEQYQISSIALQGAAGPVVRVASHVNAIVEYKVSTARPSVDVADGTITGRFTSQHVAAGLEVRW